jgi:thiamine-phosphate pyrophosphorylase
MRPRVIQIFDVGISFESVAERLASAPEAACCAIQLRHPGLSGRASYQLAVDLRRLTRERGARLIINDRADIAMAIGADGLHLGRRSMSARDARRLLGDDIWISRSCHHIDELAKLEPEIDALLLSPIFESPNKAAPLGLGTLRQVCRDTRLAVYALGGVDVAGAEACIAAGAAGVASITADLSALARQDIMENSG